MNRDLFNPLTIGAIVICIIMASFINIHPMFIFLLLAILQVYNLFFINIYSRKITIVLFAILIGIIGSKRILLLDNSDFIGIEYSNFLVGDIEVLKDSSKLNRGYISTGNIQTIKSKQFLVESKSSISIFSTTELSLGDVLTDVKIYLVDKKFVASVDKNNFLETDSVFFEIRNRLLNKLKNTNKSALLLALFIGDKNKLERSDIDAFRKSGCSHILALSGFHVGIISLLIMVILRIFFTGNKIFIFTIVILSVYLVIVGVTSSLLRSVFMFGLATIFKIKNSKISIFQILVITFYLIVLIWPKEFYSLSFQLSFLALSGILILGVELKGLFFLKCFPNILRLPISASLGAMIATSFICFPLFGEIYPVGLLASLIISPFITIFLWFGILALFFPSLNIITTNLEIIILRILRFLSDFTVIDKSSLISPFFILIISLIPVILLIIKIFRRVDARRFNIEFKL